MTNLFPTPMKILFIARYQYPSMQRKVEYLAQAPDVDLCHIVPAYQPQSADLRPPDTQRRYRQLTIPMLGSVTDPHRALYRTVTFHLHRFRPDIIHAEEEPDSLSALQIAWARRIWAPQSRLLLHTWQNQDRRKSMAVRWVIRQTLGAADLVFCANSEAITLLRRFGFAGPAPLLPAIGVDTTLFRPCAEYHGLSEQSAAKSSYTIGYIGRLVWEKGIDLLLQAVAALTSAMPDKQIQVWVTGAGPLQAELQSLARQLGIEERVVWKGAQPQHEIAKILCHLDVLVLPSRTTNVWKEQLGRVLLEAMACGIPVIGSNSGAIPEVIGDAGLIVPEGDVQALTQTLKHLLSAPDLRQTLAQRGRIRAETYYTQRHIAEQTLAIYREIMA